MEISQWPRRLPTICVTGRHVCKFCLFSFKGSGFCQVVWFVWGWIPTGLIKLIKHRQRYSVWRHQLNVLKLVVQRRTIGIWIPFKDSCLFVTFVAVVLLRKVVNGFKLKKKHKSTQNGEKTTPTSYSVSKPTDDVIASIIRTFSRAGKKEWMEERESMFSRSLWRLTSTQANEKKCFPKMIIWEKNVKKSFWQLFENSATKLFGSLYHRAVISQVSSYSINNHTQV